MTYIFLDESGDLGFNFDKKGTTKHFIVACVVTEQKRPLEKIIKTEFTKRRKGKTGPIHAHKERASTVTRILQKIQRKDCAIYAVVVDKKKFRAISTIQIHIIYNLVVNTLLELLYQSKVLSSQAVHLIISQRETSAYLNTELRSYIRKNHRSKQLTITIRPPHAEKVLQIADIISWTIFQKFEYGDDMFYRLIESKMTKPHTLF